MSGSISLQQPSSKKLNINLSKVSNGLVWLLLSTLLLVPSAPRAHAVSDGDVNCSVGGSFTVTNNVVVQNNSCAGIADIPDGVTAINHDVFGLNNDDLTGVVIPQSVLTIGPNAFASNHALKNVTFSPGSHLISIGEGAFSYAGTNVQDGLSTISFPSSLETISATAFLNSRYLSHITFEDGSHLNSIGVSAFSGTCLDVLTLPPSLHQIGDSAFWGWGTTCLTDITFLGDIPTGGTDRISPTSPQGWVPVSNSTWDSEVTSGSWRGLSLRRGVGPVAVPPTIQNIESGSTLSGMVGYHFSYTLNFTSSTPATVSISSGTLPSSLSLNSSTGEIYGDPSSAESATVSILVTDSNNETATISGITFDIQPHSAITFNTTKNALDHSDSNDSSTISTNAPSVFGAGLFYSDTSTPLGLWDFENVGNFFLNWGSPIVISSNWTQNGRATFIIRIYPPGTSNPDTTTNFLTSTTVEIYPTSSFPLSFSFPISNATLTGQVGLGQAESIAFIGGTAPESATVTNGSLPPGLVLDSNTNQISGTPTLAGTYVFDLTASDSAGESATSTNVRFVIAPSSNNSAPQSTPIPDPVQQSLITSPPPIVVSSDTNTVITVTGTFVEKVLNIQVNGSNIPQGSWTQTASTLSFAVAKISNENISVVIFNGAVPVLSVQSIALTQQMINPPAVKSVETSTVQTRAPANLQLATSTPSTGKSHAKVLSIKCVRGKNAKTVQAAKPLCPRGYVKK